MATPATPIDSSSSALGSGKATLPLPANAGTADDAVTIMNETNVGKKE